MFNWVTLQMSIEGALCEEMYHIQPRELHLRKSGDSLKGKEIFLRENINFFCLKLLLGVDAVTILITLLLLCLQ